MDANYHIINDGNDECYDLVEELKKQVNTISNELDRLDLTLIRIEVYQEYLWRTVQSHATMLEQLQRGLYAICVLLVLVATMNVTAGRY